MINFCFRLGYFIYNFFLSAFYKFLLFLIYYNKNLSNRKNYGKMPNNPLFRENKENLIISMYIRSLKKIIIYYNKFNRSKKIKRDKILKLDISEIIRFIED